MSAKRPSILLLSLLESLPSIFGVLFAPALPQIASTFHTSFGQTQFLMISYLFGYAIGQLPYGPLSNRFGRKPVLYLGISLAVISCLLCVLAGHLHLFWLFVLARFGMAFGSCVGLNIAFTIIGDLYQEKEATKTVSIIMLLSAMVPAVGTFVGGIITQHWMWTGCFYFLALFGIFVMFISRNLPETAQALDKSALQFKEISLKYKDESKNLPLILASIITGCGAGIVYLFAGTAPFIAINISGLAPEIYGMVNLVPEIGLLVGCLLTRKLIASYSSVRIMKTGLAFLVGPSFLMLLFFLFGFINPYTLFVPMTLINVGLALIFTTAAGFGLSQAKNKSIGASLMNFLNLSLCTCSVFIMGGTAFTTPALLPLLFLGLSFLILFLLGKLSSTLSEKAFENRAM